MSVNKKWLWAGAALVVFGVLKMAAVYWWAQQQPETHDVQPCDVRQGCRLKDGMMVKFSGLSTSKAPFDIEVSQVPEDIRQMSVSFSMRDMDMGFNRYDLRQQGSTVWAGRQIRLPFCVEGRHDYLADLSVKGQTYRIPFHAP